MQYCKSSAEAGICSWPTAINVGSIRKRMSLPDAILHLLRNNANLARVSQPKLDDDLFGLGILDSFALVDLISILEAESGIKIPDADVKPENFQSIRAIEQYLESRKA